ncbi:MULTISPECIES: DEAD/DEAH box helicase family protein [unclassified Mesorhizobium]|uniref:DEAD/DEAH box helicase family protein n=1 Tax=unclassified Mesorhizobium TaxID=325217 RepID=UPI0018DE1F8E|nr:MULTISPECIES: DEAD/DEAH box helicase family protein [unclassified Mesorhizobium]WJI79426.1 DEAD/DEAH box helicase family protein [Mesorhizobium sp. C374B]WJI85961.1 DEAD/DEAH box helicase family protein [Mesorhizobium sp. C372A]
MADLFTERVSITLPKRYLLRGRVAENLVRQLDAPEADRNVALDSNAKGYFSDLAERPSLALLRRGLKRPSSYDQMIRIDEVVPITSIQEVLSRPSVRWEKPAPEEPEKISLEDFAERHKAIQATWTNTLSLREEEYEGDRRIVTGFRPPQIGAIHAIKAHWVVSDAPATLVMPTGTGKTETMLGVFVSADVNKLLVIVPSDQLRTQISDKFVDLGVLKKFGLLKEAALYPIVTTLKRAPTSLDEVDAIFGCAQVVVATMQSVSRLPVELKDRIATHVTHLFVDEAHHIGAATWKAFKTHFVRQKRFILQFTATPYRNDNKRVDGKFIFVYPLRRAREQHLFRPVHYIPVMESEPAQADLSIIRR